VLYNYNQVHAFTLWKTRNVPDYQCTTQILKVASIPRKWTKSKQKRKEPLTTQKKKNTDVLLDFAWVTKWAHRQILHLSVRPTPAINEEAEERDPGQKLKTLWAHPIFISWTHYCFYQMSRSRNRKQNLCHKKKKKKLRRLTWITTLST
jgi:hypothetical protein